MVIKINYKEYLEERRSYMNFCSYYQNNKKTIKPFVFIKSHENALQKIIEEVVRYLYEEILGQEAPFQVHVFLQRMGKHSVMGFDAQLSDKDHLYLVFQGEKVIEFLNNRKTKENDFKYCLLHEMIHSTDQIVIKETLNAIRNIRKFNNLFDGKYDKLEYPLMFLCDLRTEGVATLCASFFSKWPSEFGNYDAVTSILGVHSYFHFEETFEKVMSLRNTLYGNRDYVELQSLAYGPLSKNLLLDALVNSGRITSDTRYRCQKNCLGKEEMLELYRACLSLSLPQYIAGILAVDGTGKSIIPLQTILNLCAGFQQRKDPNRISLFTLLLETTRPSTSDFIDILDEIVGYHTLDEALEVKIKALHETPVNDGMTEMVDRLWDFYLHYKDGYYHLYAFAAKRVLDYVFCQDGLIHSHLIGFYHVDDIMLMKKIWDLIQNEVFTPYLRFELNDTGTGLAVTGFNRWWCDDENYRLVKELVHDILYVPESHEIEGKVYPVVEIADDARLGDHLTRAIYIPKTVVRIGENAIKNANSRYDNDGVQSIVVDPRNPIYDSRQGCNAIIETATNRMLYGCTTTFIPYSVASIAGSALKGVKGKPDDDERMFPDYYLVIPDSVTKSDEDAFNLCDADRFYISDPLLIKHNNHRIKIVKL